MQPAAWASKIIGDMQQLALAARIIFKYLHATEQHFANYLKRRQTERSIAHTHRGTFKLVIFMKLYFVTMHKILPPVS